MVQRRRLRDFVKQHRSLFKVIATLVIAMIIFKILAGRLKGIELDDIVHSLDKIPAQAIAQATLLTLVSYGGLLASYEYLGQQYVHRFMGFKRLFLASFVTYTFNFNLGSLLGAIATRFRIYRRWQLKHSEIVRLTSACIFASWIGYVFLTGLIFVTRPEVLSHVRSYSVNTIRILGGFLLFTLFILMMVSRNTHTIHFGRWHATTFNRPQLLFALTVSTLQWLAIAGIIYVFLSCFESVDFTLVLFAYLFAAVASVIVHVPAGLGIVEGTFILVLDGVMSPAEILAAMIAFRTVYYFIPFAISLVLFSAMEFRAWRAKERRRTSYANTRS